MIRIAVVEDDDAYREQILEYLHRFERDRGEDLTISLFIDGDGIVDKYEPKYDVILMDIQMKFMDGMSAAEEIRKVDDKVMIIFITNMRQYAIRGYEVGALDYIVKPIPYFLFSEKLSKAINRMRERSTRNIVLEIRGGILRIDVDDLYYVECQSHTLTYHTRMGQYTATGSIKALEEKLADYHFSRGNNGYLINLTHVQGIQDHMAIVHGEKLMISRPRRKIFMKELTDFWGDAK